MRKQKGSESHNVSQALPESGQRRCGELGRQSFTIVPKQPKTKQPTSTLLDQAGKIHIAGTNKLEQASHFGTTICALKLQFL